MPIESVVLDYHPLGIVEVDGSARDARAARRRAPRHGRARAARRAPGGSAPRGRRPRGVRHDPRAATDGRAGDRARPLPLDRRAHEPRDRDRPTCEFTRVITSGIDQIVAEVAARAGVPVRGRAAPDRLASAPASSDRGRCRLSRAAVPAGRRHRRRRPLPSMRSVARVALGDGIRRIAAEVRNSLDFHLGSHGESPITRAILTGPALDLTGFDLALGRELGLTADPRRGRARLAGGRRTRADEPARGRGRAVGRGGAEVKAVNLIPHGSAPRRGRSRRTHRRDRVRRSTAAWRCSSRSA